ncbi:MAG: ATP-dependent sacrificial sulfur transferase LarE, partial [Planctomycetota bacterium]|nr:ATP-dependent sacrificial sulfur transferase LarE [Planctomycetota bacterium]
AFLALGDKAVAVTAVSPSLAGGELDAARQLARQIGIRHETIATGELENPDYVANQADRCYHCKTELYDHLDRLCDRFSVAVVLNGANADDLQDYRPGLQAAREHRVLSPLAECGITKDDVRQLAAAWELPVWDKPAAPCLSSRIAYGEEVTPQRLEMIDRAEQFLRDAGLREVRVRFHKGDLARLEVPLDDLPQLTAPDFRAELVAQLRELGFRYISLDLEGFRSGSQNLVLPLEIVNRRS